MVSLLELVSDSFFFLFLTRVRVRHFSLTGIGGLPVSGWCEATGSVVGIGDTTFRNRDAQTLASTENSSPAVHVELDVSQHVRAEQQQENARTHTLDPVRLDQFYVRTGSGYFATAGQIKIVDCIGFVQKENHWNVS